MVAFLALGIVAVAPILAHGLPLRDLSEVLFRAPAWREFLMPPRLHFLSVKAHSTVPEFWGLALPISCLLPALVGLVWGLAVNDRRFPRRVLLAILGIAVCIGLFCFGGWVGYGIQRLTDITDGFRVYARFFPFLMFFVCALAVIGIDLALTRDGLRKPVLAGLLIVAAFEYYPFLLNHSPVLHPRIPHSVLDAVEDGRFIVYMPKASLGRKLNDTFQVAVDKPVVHLSHLGREAWSVERIRMQGFKYTFGSYHVQLTAAWYDEARKLNIGYIYVEDESTLSDFKFPYEILYADDSGVFVKVL